MLRPLEDKVILEMIEPEEITKGGIVLPSKAQEKSQMAKVVSVGPGKNIDGRLMPMNVSIDQVVIINKYSGTEILSNALFNQVMAIFLSKTSNFHCEFVSIKHFVQALLHEQSKYSNAFSKICA